MYRVECVCKCRCKDIYDKIPSDLFEKLYTNSDGTIIEPEFFKYREYLNLHI